MNGRVNNMKREIIKHNNNVYTILMSVNSDFDCITVLSIQTFIYCHNTVTVQVIDSYSSAECLSAIMCQTHMVVTMHYTKFVHNFDEQIPIKFGRSTAFIMLVLASKNKLQQSLKTMQYHKRVMPISSSILLDENCGLLCKNQFVCCACIMLCLQMSVYWREKCFKFVFIYFFF